MVGVSWYETESPIWLLLFGGLSIAAGLFLFGKRVITTMGTNITKMTQSRGFCVEISAAVTVIFASAVGLPVSTTHCQVGSVVAAGFISGGSNNVNFGLFGKIFLSWLCTIPFSMGLSAGLYYILQKIVLV